MVMIAIFRSRLRASARTASPKLSINSKCPTNDRKTPTRNTAERLLTANDHGIENPPFRPGQSFGTNLMTRIHDDGEMHEAVRERGWSCIPLGLRRGIHTGDQCRPGRTNPGHPETCPPLSSPTRKDQIGDAEIERGGCIDE